MDTGINEAVQVISVGIKGIETALRMSGTFTAWTIKEIAQLTKFIIYQKENARRNPKELKDGEVSLDKLFRRNAEKRQETLVMQIDEKILPEFEEFAKKNKLRFSYLVDVNLSDTYKEVAYSSEQAVAFKSFIEKYYPSAHDYSFKEYTNNATPSAVEEIDDVLSGETKDRTKTSPVLGTRTPEDIINETAYVNVVTLKKSDAKTFSKLCADAKIDTAVIFSNEDMTSFVSKYSDIDSVRSYAYRFNAKCQNLAEFLNENRWVQPSKEVIEAAKMGQMPASSSEKIIEIDNRQIVDANEYSVKIEIISSGEPEYIDVPAYQLFKSDKEGKMNLLLHEHEILSVYDNSKFLSYDGTEYVYQIANQYVYGQQLIPLLEKENKKWDKEKVEIKDNVYSISDYYTNSKLKAAEDVKYNNREVIDITIDKASLNVKQKGNAVISRVPGTWGAEAKYLVLSKDDVKEVGEGKAIFTQLDKDKVYNLYDKSGINVLGRMNGAELYHKHYSPAIYKKKKTAPKKPSNPRTRK